MERRKISPLTFNISVKPALKSRGRLSASRVFPPIRERGKDSRRMPYDLEVVLKLAANSDRGVVWAPCYMNPWNLRKEEIMLRRAEIGQEDLWIPVRPSSGFNRWTELMMPRLVSGDAVWVSAEGIEGYLRPVSISGVQVWIPTPNNDKELMMGRNPKKKTTLRCGRKDIWQKKPPPVSPEEQKKSRERKLCRAALRSVARKLTTKLADVVYPTIDLNGFSEECSEESADNSQEEEGEEMKCFSSLTSLSSIRMPSPQRVPNRKRKYFGNWEEEDKERAAQNTCRRVLTNGRMVNFCFLPGQETPVIIASGENNNR